MEKANRYSQTSLADKGWLALPSPDEAPFPEIYCNSEEAGKTELLDNKYQGLNLSGTNPANV